MEQPRSSKEMQNVESIVVGVAHHCSTSQQSESVWVRRSRRPGFTLMKGIDTPLTTVYRL